MPTRNLGCLINRSCLREDVFVECAHHVAGSLVSSDTVFATDSHSELDRSLPDDLSKVAGSADKLQVVEINFRDFTVPSIGSVSSFTYFLGVAVHGEVLSTSLSLITLRVLHLV